MRILAAFASLSFAVLPAAAAVYRVGQDPAYPSIASVPWTTLQPGDTVRIHWRSTPYKEKWVIGRQGTAAAPITISGVPNASGQLPIIDGNGAVTPPSLDYWSEERGIIKVGGSTKPASVMAAHIIIENLDVRNAKAGYGFRNDYGSARVYLANAAAIFIERGENITIRNCILRDSGLGLFVASSATWASRNIMVDSNRIYNNGNVNSSQEHNIYTAAIGITFQYNRLGPLTVGSKGHNIKDRSAGTVIRYNWIEGGERQIDLVDAATYLLIRGDPSYTTSFVYGNILLEYANAGNRNFVHYGGDSADLAGYRRGILYFFNNTAISYRTDRTTLFRMSTDSERCDARNNIFYTTAAGSTVAVLDNRGTVDFMSNWIKPGWVSVFPGNVGTVNNLGGLVQTTVPGFVSLSGQDFRLASGSVAANAGTFQHALTQDHPVNFQYVKHQLSQPRPADLTIDMGAYELAQ